MRKLMYFFFLLMAAPPGAAAQDPDIEANEQAAFEEFFRSSDLDGETPVGRRGRTKRVSVPAGAVRLGCVCMDDTESPARSIGACSGHGGVRYWLYRTREGDTVRILTAKHEQHPHPLDSIERSALVRPPSGARRQATIGPAAAQVIVVQQPPAPFAAPAADPGNDGMEWPEALGIGAGGALSVLVVRLLLAWAEKQTPAIRDALYDLLRHRKRPPARKDGKNARPPRL